MNIYASSKAARKREAIKRKRRLRDPIERVEIGVGDPEDVRLLRKTLEVLKGHRDSESTELRKRIKVALAARQRDEEFRASLKGSESSKPDEVPEEGDPPGPRFDAHGKPTVWTYAELRNHFGSAHAEVGQDFLLVGIQNGPNRETLQFGYVVRPTTNGQRPFPGAPLKQHVRLVSGASFSSNACRRIFEDARREYEVARDKFADILQQLEWENP